jgi:2-polyprenyl-3-methyl-5-hydroxy-6-metoxy-1,4-benzoquinol methylase
MDSDVLNQYGDTKIDAGTGHGVDVASQRADDLDEECLSFISNRVESAAGGQVFAADIGCGMCGQGLRMARRGAYVACVDITNKFDEARATAAKESLKMAFLSADLREIDTVLTAPIDVIICQRTIHYLDYPSAVKSLALLHRMFRPGGKLFISASGIRSELGAGYPAAIDALPVRKAMLSKAMQVKHNIEEPVCLYSEDDMRELLTSAGFSVDRVYSSAFGNIKAIASPKGN